MSDVKYILSIPFRMVWVFSFLIIGIFIVPAGILGWLFESEKDCYISPTGRYLIRDWWRHICSVMERKRR